MKNRTSEYEVCHPKWDWYKVKDHQLDLDFQKMYGTDFACLNEQQPVSVMLAEGSPVEVKIKKYVA
ncbi:MULTISPECIES: hypothetical protein [Chryseobacterium]|uniref:Uncharacterized protein n=1 Tax=Chryseobacterium camelliae TaxID=1265445 RepID=A0ABU0TI94_9FLAO|nr:MULTISPECIES: hypothetical protein [Chryseobacterium]MDT3409357.1 hypothetical protein [Pseudacidovorax intermedius]MDQ1096779.1 hypothetical protein [Chryseobacterium camelliae]MDQ1100721.1 hypothetical protein [Chryseobacterium sp. SORGH_AS_1048]MDR6088060.1 hypothetical protein [Chryseobacterium sp. SORGH_AS_0909]MDR6132435.1 hypothetical protein [Chryseobacterium sp. SORGH_AS_1175]